MSDAKSARTFILSFLACLTVRNQFLLIISYQAQVFCYSSLSGWTQTCNCRISPGNWRSTFGPGLRLWLPMVENVVCSWFLSFFFPGRTLNTVDPLTVALFNRWQFALGGFANRRHQQHCLGVNSALVSSRCSWQLWPEDSQIWHQHFSPRLAFLRTCVFRLLWKNAKWVYQLPANGSHV